MQRDSAHNSTTILAGISRGIQDMHAGRVIPHKQAMRRLRKTIARAKTCAVRSTN
jgi:predicted transcriptional regulator